MYNTFWQRSLFVWGQLFSVKIFDRSRSGFQVIRLGAGDDFRGPSGHALPLPLGVSLSRAHSFLRPLLPSTCYAGYNFPEASARKECKITHYCFVKSPLSVGVWGLGMQLTSALHYKEERNFPWDLSWQIARVFGYPRQESQSVFFIWHWVSFVLLREKLMLTLQISCKDESNGEILKQNFELVCWVRCRNNISQKYVLLLLACKQTVGCRRTVKRNLRSRIKKRAMYPL